MLSSQLKLSADRQTPIKQYAPDLSVTGHKNQSHEAPSKYKLSKPITTCGIGRSSVISISYNSGNKDSCIFAAIGF